MRAVFITEELDMGSGHTWKLYCKSPIGLCQAYTPGGRYCLKNGNNERCRFLEEVCMSYDGEKITCGDSHGK